MIKDEKEIVGITKQLTFSISTITKIKTINKQLSQI
jgi:hypothetical protein